MNWFWLLIGCSLWVACAYWLAGQFRQRRYRPKQRETPTAVGWQTSLLSEPEPEALDFGAFYALLAQHGRYTRKQAARMYALSMYETIEAGAIQQAEDVLDEYDIREDARDIVKEVWYEEKGA